MDKSSVFESADGDVCEQMDKVNLNNNYQEAPPNGNLLKALLESAQIDPRVLKGIHRFLSANPSENSIHFVEVWKRVYYPFKQSLLFHLVDTYYDKVSSGRFESYINTQRDNYSDARQELQRLIEEHEKEYIASGCLRVSSLEKMISLLIARDVMPLNFYLIFNFACSGVSEISCLKAQLLESIMDLHLVGYDPETDQRLFNL
ncbi:unnamed protein product [Caenorhabditis sp. 36 PRJEB53466]|nr:unnamed protein product [Caenorhabditis sp. 36 PRJEB53466]